MQYILVVEEIAEYGQLIESTVLPSLPMEFVQAKSVQEAKQVLEEQGPSELIFINDKCCGLEELRSYDGPLIICSELNREELVRRYPFARGYVEKSHGVEDIEEVYLASMARYKSLLTYVPIKITLLQYLGEVYADLYIRLSYSHYVKVLKKGENFEKQDAERFYRKGIQELFVTAPDAKQFLEFYQQYLEDILGENELGQDDNGESAAMIFSQVSFENVLQLGRILGWNAPVVETAKKSVSLAIKVIAQDPEIFKILKLRLFTNSSDYQGHVSQLSLLCCSFCHLLGWTKYSEQLKLAMAALLHDLFVEDEYYFNIVHWNACAQDQDLKDIHTVKYRNHPVEAAQRVLSIPHLPDGVDGIILQHHETSNGEGFPRNVSAEKIDPLTCVFIIAEDLLMSLGHGITEENVFNFFHESDARYQVGHFQRIFQVIKTRVKASMKL